eukprot:Amastigsp_a339426_77.p3 type:complete len:138 gc:universal Amastigsp_a339426_77:994-581(-)
MADGARATASHGAATPRQGAGVRGPTTARTATLTREGADGGRTRKKEGGRRGVAAIPQAWARLVSWRHHIEARSLGSEKQQSAARRGLGECAVIQDCSRVQRLSTNKMVQPNETATRRSQRWRPRNRERCAEALLTG